MKMKKKKAVGKNCGGTFQRRITSKRSLGNLKLQDLKDICKNQLHLLTELRMGVSDSDECRFTEVHL